jgi:hypothetical protein
VIATFKQRDVWMRALVADHSLSPMTRLVGVRLGLHFNCKTGRCDPSYATLAAEVAISERSAIRAVSSLKAQGWIAVKQRGGGYRTYSNNFTLQTPNDEVTGESPHKSDVVTQQSGWGDRPVIYGVTQESPKKRREERREEQGYISPSRRAAQARATDDDNGFDEFWRVYPRKVARGAAAKAYGRVLRKGQASEAELLAGAHRYASERAGQEQKFTKHPANWLDGECWRDEPLPRGQVIIDQDGNEVKADEGSGWLAVAARMQRGRSR